MLELTIVLIVLSLMLSGLFGPLAMRVEQADRRQTMQQLQEAQQAIYGYALRTGRLPCPDCRDPTTGSCAQAELNTGKESRNPDDQSCHSETGNLPWVTLGVKATDAWGNRLTYRVDPRFADSQDGTGSEHCRATPGVSFELCAEGNMEVRQDHADAVTLVARHVPAIILSHGKNGGVSDTWSDFELQNDGSSLIFVDRSYGHDFDDMLAWISPHQLRLKMLQAGLLP